MDSMLDSSPLEDPGKPQPSRGRPRIIWMGAATVAIALVVAMWPGGQRPTTSSTREAHLPFGSPEQHYAPKIQIDDLALSRADNFLNQEVTMLGGRVTNGGDLPLANVELTVEFSDELGQVVLRESRAVLTAPSNQLSPGERRKFEVSFEHIPSSWNIQLPSVRVSGILFTSRKE